jgi:hypothetical protein
MSLSPFEQIAYVAIIITLIVGTGFLVFANGGENTHYDNSPHLQCLGSIANEWCLQNNCSVESVYAYRAEFSTFQIDSREIRSIPFSKNEMAFCGFKPGRTKEEWVQDKNFYEANR